MSKDCLVANHFRFALRWASLYGLLSVFHCLKTLISMIYKKHAKRAFQMSRQFSWNCAHTYTFLHQYVRITSRMNFVGKKLTSSTMVLSQWTVGYGPPWRVSLCILQSIRLSRSINVYGLFCTICFFEILDFGDCCGVVKFCTCTLFSCLHNQTISVLDRKGALQIFVLCVPAHSRRKRAAKFEGIYM